MQAKGLLLASIEDPNPVIFLEPKFMYRVAGKAWLPMACWAVLQELTPGSITLHLTMPRGS